MVFFLLIILQNYFLKKKQIIGKSLIPSMNKYPCFEINDGWILSRRGKKNKVDPFIPYAYFVEKELTISGHIEDTAVIFLTNSECAYRCLMCDLWKNTTNEPVPAGAIPKQIEWALSHLSPARHIKLYNSGNFFDKKAIPKKDYGKIASLVKNFRTLVIENHPGLINENCLDFRNMVKPELQVAMGLETVHPEILARLNKRMDPKDFENAVRFLNKNDILSRAFILLRPPFMSEQEGIYWAKRSIDFAFQSGVECCTVIPVRAGNGAMDYLFREGFFSPPRIPSLEAIMEYGLRLKAGRIFSDVWNIEEFTVCPECIHQRKNRLVEMNLYQKMVPPVECACIKN
jgi:radical SAM enzyme (TIGR01210 family)